MPSRFAGRAWWLAGAGVAAAAAALAWYLHQASGSAPAPVLAGPGGSAGGPGGAPIFGPIGAAPDGGAPAAARAQRLQQLREHLVQVDQTLCDYRAGTRYPPSSRPIGEHPDQVYPNVPVTESKPLHGEDGKSDPAVHIQSSQSRVFMVAGEAVALSLRAVDSEGMPLALVVRRALAQGMTYQGRRPSASVALAFADDGQGADAVAGDGAFAAVLAPAQTGLASFNGTIRAEVRYTAAGRAGVLLFDVVYSPEVPATWSGQVREAEEAGSLAFYLKAEVRQPGRYIVNGRVDDARGKPFALATFNEVLGPGAQEVKLLVFGKLLHDQAPALPLSLRDVDGYLLKENTDPDRALMPRLEGKAFTGKLRPLKNFSDAEWQSEERTRHLDEFGRDVAQARAALAQAEPGLAQPASACTQEGRVK